MNRDEIAAILKGLAADFERLMDLQNMDWSIFEYETEPPWFFIQSGFLDAIDRDNHKKFGYDPETRFDNGTTLSDRWDEHDRQVAVLRGRFLETIEALRVAAEEIT